MKFLQRSVHALAVIAIGLGAHLLATLASFSIIVSKFDVLSVDIEAPVSVLLFLGLLLVSILIVLAGCFLAIRQKIKWRWVVLLVISALLLLVPQAHGITAAELVVLTRLPELVWFWFILVQLSLLLIGTLCYWVIRRQTKWQWIACAGLAVVSALAYFASDTAAVPIADLGVRVGEDDAGYRTLMWMADESPYSRLAESETVNADEVKFLSLPSKSGEWPRFIRKNRDEIIKYWDADKLGREWIDAINETPPKGLWVQGFNAPVISYRSVRASMTIRTAYAALLASDMRHDEAVAVLIPMIKAMYHYSATSEAVTNGMLVSTVLKQCYSVATEIIKSGELAAATRDSLRGVLAEAPPLRQIIRQSIIGEQDGMRGLLDNMTGLWFQVNDPVTVGGRLLKFSITTGSYKVFLNRNRTEQLALDALTQVADMTELRNEVELKLWRPDRFFARESGIRNPVGVGVLQMTYPEFYGLAASLWMCEDLRLALLTQLEKL